MRLITVLTLLILGIASSNSQWISNYGGNSGSDLNLNSADGNCVTADNYGYSYAAGYVTNTGTGKDILLIKYGPAGDTLWTRTYNGTENQDDQAFGIATDNSSNIYITGVARMTGKYEESILIKYSSSGSLLWAKTYGATAGYNSDRGNAIALDASGNIYVTGYCTDSDLRRDILTNKYDCNGNKKWTKQEDGVDNLDAEGCSIAVDSQGRAVVTGYCTTYQGGKDIIVLKYEPTNPLVWMRTYSGTSGSEDKTWGIAVDQTDNIYVTGYTTVSASNTNSITLKYSSTGTNLWTKTYNGSGNSTDKAWGIAVDSDNLIYITGESTDAYNNLNYFTAKYDASGNQVWVSSYNGTGNGTDAAVSIGVFTDANNIKNVVVTGKSWGTNNNFDYATVKYNAGTGSQTQVSRYSLNGLTNDIAKDLCVSDALNKVYVTGCSELIVESNQEESYVSTMMLDFGHDNETGNNSPEKFALHQNYPNPFNPSTTIKFDITASSRVKLAVYDMLGRVVDVLVNQDLEAGSYSIMYNNKGLSSGIYFYELTAGSMKEIRKMTLVK